MKFTDQMFTSPLSQISLAMMGDGDFSQNLSRLVANGRAVENQERQKVAQQQLNQAIASASKERDPRKIAFTLIAAGMPADQAIRMAQMSAAKNNNTLTTDANGRPVLIDTATGKAIRPELPGGEQFPSKQAKAPEGYRYTESGKELEPIPGGKADTSKQDAAILENTTADLDRLEASVDDLLAAPGLGRITGFDGMLPNRPGGDAANASAKLETLKSQVGFGVLQNMRQNSKTGGALGNVSDAENQRLENNLAALDTAQSDEEFVRELMKIKQYTQNSKQRFRKAYEAKYGNITGYETPGKPMQLEDPLGIR